MYFTFSPGKFCHIYWETTWQMSHSIDEHSIIRVTLSKQMYSPFRLSGTHFNPHRRTGQVFAGMVKSDGAQILGGKNIQIFTLFFPNFDNFQILGILVLSRKMCPFRHICHSLVTTNCLAFKLKFPWNQVWEIVFVYRQNQKSEKGCTSFGQ